MYLGGCAEHIVAQLVDPCYLFGIKTHLLLPWKSRALQLKLQLYLEVYFKAIACLHLCDQRLTVELQHMRHFVIANGTKHCSADAQI